MGQLLSQQLNNETYQYQSFFLIHRAKAFASQLKFFSNTNASSIAIYI